MGTASTKSRSPKRPANREKATALAPGRTSLNRPEAPAENDISQRTWLIASAAILLVAAFLRLYDLDLVPLHHDEGVNGNFLVRLVREGVLPLRSGELPRPHALLLRGRLSLDSKIPVWPQRAKTSMDSRPLPSGVCRPCSASRRLAWSLLCGETWERSPRLAPPSCWLSRLAQFISRATSFMKRCLFSSRWGSWLRR